MSLQKSDVRMRLPQKIGIGTSLTYKKTTYALDYLFNQYANIYSDDSRIDFRNSHELRAGFCYHPDGGFRRNVRTGLGFRLRCAIPMAFG